MEGHWPWLSAMARDHLPTLTTSAGVKRVLNSGRDVVSYRRCHLKPGMIRKLVMMKHAMATGLTTPHEEDVDDDEAEPYESLTVRRDMVWAWSTNLRGEGEGDIDESSNEHSIRDVEHDHGGEEGEVGGRWHPDNDDFVNVDFAAASSDNDVSLPELVSQRQRRRALCASTEHAGTPVSNSFFRVCFANTDTYCVVGAAATGRVTWKR
jgi:hypothetical protein